MANEESRDKIKGIESAPVEEGLERVFSVENGEMGDVEDGSAETEGDVVAKLKGAREQLGLASEIQDERPPQEILKEVIESLYPSSSELYDINQLELAIEGRDDIIQKTEQIKETIDLIKQRREYAKEARVLSKVVNAVASSISRLVDVKSPWTGLHSFNASAIGLLTAERMGHGGDIVFMNEFNYALKMHDVGKTKVNPEVLNFTGQFHEKEGYREEMNSHAKKGAEISGPLRIYAEYVPPHEVAVGHHEKWDGSGYPRGLVGERIAWSARVGAVADVVEALAAKRPYKPTLPMGQVEEIIWKNSGKEFDPLVVAANVDMFLSQLPPFDKQTTLIGQEARISKMIEENGPYSETKTRELYSQGVEELREVTVGFERRQEDFIDLFDLVDSIDKRDMNSWENMIKTLHGDVEDIRNVITKRQDASIDTLFILSNAINACYEGSAEAKKKITSSDVKTQNVVRMSLMIAQQMGFGVSEQQAVFKRALFANAGMIGIQTEKVSSPDILGVADFKSLRESSGKGSAVLHELTKDREVAKYFDNIVPKNMDELSPEDKKTEHEICEIVKVASVIVALRSRAGYKGQAMGQDETMRVLRPWVGKIFDSEIWKHVEGSWAANAFGGTGFVSGSRPEVVGYASDLMKGYQPEIIYKTDESRELARVGAKVGDALNNQDNMFDALMEGIEYRNESGLRDQDPDSILSGCALDIAIQQLDFDKLNKVENARKFDLNVSFTKRMEMFNARLTEADSARSSLDRVIFIKKASAVLLSLILDFGDAGQHPNEDQMETIVESAERIREKYRNTVDDLLGQLEGDVLKDDNIAIDVDEKVIDMVLIQIDDGDLIKEIEGKVKSIKDKIFGVRLQFKVQQIKRAIKQRDVSTGVTFMLEARELLAEIKEGGGDISGADLDVLEIELYRRGYPRMLEMLNKEVNDEQASGVYALALTDRTKEVMHRAESAEVRKEYFDNLVGKAVGKVRQKSGEFLESDNLMLEDVSKIGIWLQALDQAAVAIGESAMGEEEKEMFKQKTFGTILNNLPKEFESVSQESDSDSLRQFISNLHFYSQRLTEVFPEYLDNINDVMQDAGRALFDCLIGELTQELEEKKNDVVLSSIASFEKFCEGNGKEKPIISLSDEQVLLLKQRKVQAYGGKLDYDILAIEQSTVDISNIMSGVEPRLRLLVDIEYLNAASDNIKKLWAEISEGNKDDSECMQDWRQHTSEKICTVISGFVMSEISRHFKDGEYELIADLVENMRKIPDTGELVNRQGVVTKDVENLVLEYGDEIVQHLAESGDWPTLQKWQNTFEQGVDKEGLCLNNYIKRQVMILRRFGSLGYLNSVAKILCEIKDLDEKYPQYNLMEDTGQYIEGLSDDNTVENISGAAEYYLDKYTTSLSICLPLFKTVGVLANVYLNGAQKYAVRIKKEVEETTLQEKAAWVGRISAALANQ